MRYLSRRDVAAWLLSLAVSGTVLAGGAAPVRAQGAGAAWECAPAAAASTGSPAAAWEGAATPAAMAMDAAFPAEGGDLTVFAAASLTDAFTTIGEDIQAANPDVTVTFNFAGSQALVTQLTEGAEADVFASANNTQMTAAADAGLVTAEAVPFVENQLVIVVPADNPAGIDDPADLATDGVKLVLANPDVPVGRYSRESLCLMGADTATYGDDFVGAVAGNVVSEEDDVREVLTKVQLGEADAGIVYVSDSVVGGDEIARVEIPAGVNVLAVYPIAPLAEGDQALAEAFIAYVLSPESQAVLGEYGFEEINPAP